MIPTQPVEALLEQLTRGEKSLQPSGLIDRLARRTQLPRLDIREALAHLAREGKISGVSKTGEPWKKVRWQGDRPGLSVSGQHLHDALTKLAHGLTEAQHRQLQACADLFDGLGTEDIEEVLRGLIRCGAGEPNRPIIFTSAEQILGSAKAFNNLKRPARALGLERADTSGGEVYALTAAPAEPKAIVLIENIRSFTAFAHSAHAQQAIGVAAFGYGLSMEHLALHLVAGRVIACPAYGAPVDLQRAFTQLPALFWGDLDQEGLRIYESLRRQLPQLKLSGAYTAMEARLCNNALCHPYHPLFEKQGQRPLMGETTETAHLAQRCRLRAVDQEALGTELDDVDVVGIYRIPAPRVE